MSFHIWGLFCGFAVISVLSPGPAVLLSVSNSLQLGIRASFFSSLGNITGLFLVSGAAVLGLGAVLKTSAVLFGLFKVCGAVYLIYLGIRQWLARPVSMEALSESCSAPSPAERPGPGDLFVQGIFVALSNPKAILFFTALLPQFMDMGRAVFPQFLIMTLTFMAFSFLALMGWAWCVLCFKFSLLKGRGQVWMNRISGTVFILFGVGLLGLKQRSNVSV